MMGDETAGGVGRSGEYELLVDYLSGLASPEQRAAIEARAAADPAFRSMLEETSLIWDRVPLALPAAPATLKPLRLEPRRRGWQSPYRQASALLAAAAVVLIVAIPVWRGATSRPIDPAAAATEVREHRTGANQRMRLALSDGSVVELGANSVVRVPATFDGATREVELEGLAFFDVAPDPARPFLVHSGNATTRVLGTEFVVQAYLQDGEVRVAVTEGRVTFGPKTLTDRSSTLLTPGQVGLLAIDGVATVIQDRGELNRLVGWKDGRREYIDVPLSRVLFDLERWYGQRIVAPDAELAARPVSTVLTGEPLDQVLHLIALVVDAEYERRGGTIVFTAQQPHPSP
jgi:ferric-dicitrate binding protein FerR (iron transport regulator)